MIPPAGEAEEPSGGDAYIRMVLEQARVEAEHNAEAQIAAATGAKDQASRGLGTELHPLAEQHLSGYDQSRPSTPSDSEWATDPPPHSPQFADGHPDSSYALSSLNESLKVAEQRSLELVTELEATREHSFREAERIKAECEASWSAVNAQQTEEFENTIRELESAYPSLLLSACFLLSICALAQARLRRRLRRERRARGGPDKQSRHYGSSSAGCRCSRRRGSLWSPAECPRAPILPACAR